MKTPKVSKSIALPVDLIIIIQKIAEEKGKSFSEVVSELLIKALKDEGYLG